MNNKIFLVTTCWVKLMPHPFIILAFILALGDIVSAENKDADRFGNTENARKILGINKIEPHKISDVEITAIFNLDYRPQSGGEGFMYKGIAIQILDRDNKHRGARIVRLIGILIESKNECQFISSDKMKSNLPADGILLDQNGIGQIYIDVNGWLSSSINERRIMLVCDVNTELTLLF